MKKKLLIVGWVLLFSLLTVGIVLGFSASNVDGVWGLIDAASDGTVVDVIGEIGNITAPGGSDQTKTRLQTVCSGDLDGDIGFAEWNEVANYTFTGLGSYTSTCATTTSLFFSEYVYDRRILGTDSLAVEIFNKTGAAVNLDGWAVRLYTSATAYTVIPLNAVSLANNDVYVLAGTKAANDTTQEDQTFTDNENFRTVVLVQGYRPENEAGATCDNYATGGDRTLGGLVTTVLTSWWNQTPPNTDWNQVRYGEVGGTCASTPAFFATQSGMGFNGENSIPPVTGFNEPFLLGQFCHYNNPITAVNLLDNIDLNIEITDIQCEAPILIEGPADPPNVTFNYNFVLDETPNSTPCAYTTDPAGPVCADAIFIAQDASPAYFKCMAPGTPEVEVEFTVAIMGFNPLDDEGECPAEYDPTQSMGAFISNEGTSNCACFYGVFTDYAPTAVDLLSFTGTRTVDGILLEWQTADEIDNLGFNLYRATSESGTKVKLNVDLIPTNMMPGSLVGGSYSFEDFTATTTETYFYWLEDVDASGTTTMHGPVEVP